mmetsp:Transcript_9470/g.13046  ORF Transcript_9470/g.13046 Transcript_9470/m.13046 type:complete len:514 (+) Transcript_9470:59-1600(+)
MSRSYDKDLWEGHKVILERYEEGYSALKELLEYFKERISSEETYTKNLQKQIKNVTGGKENDKGVPGFMHVFRAQLENEIKAHINYTLSLNSNLITQLETFKNDQSKMKKTIETESSRVTKELEKAKSNVTKAKSKLTDAQKDAEQCNNQIRKLTNENTGGSKDKDIVKAKQKLTTLQKAIEQADIAFKGSVSELHQQQAKYDEDMKKVLIQFQQLEEKRLAYMAEVATKYASFHETLCSSLQQTAAPLKTRAQEIDIQAELQAFIEKNATGASPLSKSGGPVIEEVTAKKESESKGLTSFLKDSFLKESPLANPNANVVIERKDAAPAEKKETPPEKKEAPPEKKEQPVVEKKEQPVEKKEQPTDKPAESSEATTPRQNQPTKKARAVFDYDATEENELSFKEGDILLITRTDDSGWWVGKLDGKVGLFPGNYCELLDESAAPEAPVESISASPAVKKCVALYEFTASSDDELGIEEGETITVIKVVDDWILGENSKGKRGVFPANYVKMAD